MIKLINSSGITIEQNQTFSLFQNTRYYTTKRKVKNGLWYFEGTCYSGAGYVLFGFQTNNGWIAFYPFSHIEAPTIRLEGDIKINQSNPMQELLNLPFAVEYPYTVGVGIDTHQYKFSVYYKKYVHTIVYNKNAKITSIDVDVWGSVSERSNEEVSVNFGAFPFEYTVPAFHPWEETVKPFYCSKIFQNKIEFTFFAFILIYCLN